MSFQVIDRNPPRFDRDFELAPVGDTVPSAEQRELLKLFDAAKNALVAGRAADDAESLCATLVDARRRWWVATAEKLRAAAEQFAAGAADADAIAATTRRLEAIEAERVGSRPDIAIANLPDDHDLFAGNFRVKPENCQLSPSEQRYVDALHEMLDDLQREAKDEKPAAGAAPQFSDAMLAERRKLREGAARQLRVDAGYFREGTDPKGLTDNILFYRGKYRGLLERLGQSLFALSVIEDNGVAVDLKIDVMEGLPAPNDVVSAEKQELFVQINNANTVIGTVCQQIREQALQPYRIDKIEAAKKRADGLLDEYVRKLAGIGRLGLEGPHTTLAKLALASLKAEFTAREAGRVKNHYVRRLGVFAGTFAVGFLMAYVAIRVGACTAEMWKAHPAACPSAWWSNHKTFLLAAAGASVGTWLSFAVRRLDLPFEELPLLDEHSLDPPFRILFVVALTLMACLLFWTGTINIHIGDLKTDPDNFKATGSIAVLVGLFCGLSERALATAMSNRAAGFVGGLAGAH